MKGFFLELAPLLGGGKLLLLRPTDAMRIGKDGRHVAVPREQAGRYLDRLRGPSLMLLVEIPNTHESDVSRQLVPFVTMK